MIELNMHDKTLFLILFLINDKHISEALISLISILQAVKSAIKNTGKKPGPNTEIYGPRSKYGSLRTARRRIRMLLQSHTINGGIYWRKLCISYLTIYTRF